ncbi:hypothetical protein LCGC14_0442720 [marine sediment metagenome]|uniref:Uncharacterized protein n=1 Tax=marine sediment metagenome TaxID=412755 RepID=A0A0F9T3A7_9ZZZZ
MSDKSEAGSEILLRTLAHFMGASSAMQGRPGSEIATTSVRLGMIIALQHPEYAQAYYKITQGVHSEADALEDDVVKSFINHIPLTSVILGADNEEKGD